MQTAVVRAQRRREKRRLGAQIKKLMRENPGKSVDEYAEMVAEMLKEEIVNGRRN